MAEASSVLSLKPKLKDINKYRELDEECYSLGIELEVDDKELDILEEKYSDPHKRMIKMFGIWLNKGENPTYRKLIKALVNVDKRNVAESICTELGLTSSLDSLLETTPPAKLSEHAPPHISQTKETDTKSSEPVTDQMTLYTHSTATESTQSHDQLSKGDSTDTSDSSHHSKSRSVDKNTSTAPCDIGTTFRNSKESEDHALSCDTSTSENENSQVHHHLTTSTSIDTSLVPAYKAITRCHDKLVTALSDDVLSISGILMSKEFITAELSSKMLLHTLTPQEKATMLVNAVTKKIELEPERFQQLINIFSEQSCTKVIVTSLLSHESHEQVAEDRRQDKAEVISIHQQFAVCEGHMYTAWGTLDPDDKIDLEARLSTDAEAIGEEFAHLFSMARDSFQQRGITPQQLADTLLDLTVYKPGSTCHDVAPLLKEEGGALMRAQSVREIFHALRPHMSFFNYEILQFLIKAKGSKDDKDALATFLRNFTEFCKRHVFEVPFTTYSNGHHTDNKKTKQSLHIKVTEHFKEAFFIKSTSEAIPSTSNNSQANNVCSRKLEISLKDAKSIQRKVASILDLNPSSLFLDSISEGCVLLTFLLPICVSLAGLDHHPEIELLSSNGVIIVCGPPGKPQLKELTPNGVVMTWPPPEYGCDSLAKYILYYQKKYEHETSEWQKLELDSLENESDMSVSDLSDGDTYVFKICTVSNVGTLQYSDESDPIVWSGMRYFISNAHKVMSTCREMLTLIFSSTDIKEITTSLLAEGIISKEIEAQISVDLPPTKKAMILVDAVRVRSQLVPEKFEFFGQVLTDHSLMSNVVETIRSEFGGDICDQYMKYLKWLYTSLLNKQSSSPEQWPPSVTKKYFRLAMIQNDEVQRGKIDDKFVQMTITGKIDDILRLKYPIKLENIFKETGGQRKVILLEGAPGCGKSTLSVYICQQWDKGQLFNQFRLVILVRLRDPVVQSANSLTDLLPCPDTKSTQLLARIMREMKCRHVLFILDGWDELPLNLRKKSIFDDLVNSHLPWSNPLSESTVIVTSRPISSGDLYPHVSSRVEVLGFTAKELHHFFTECLRGDTEAVKTLLEKIEENPEVASSCYLPLNATILVHLFKSDRNTLPTTLYGIFSGLLLNCMNRHLKLRTQYKDVSIESLDQLPEIAKKPFLFLCQAAYNGVMEDKIIFTSLPPDVNTLSLLQGVESIIGREKAVSYNFIHLSIQELLAAWYIATQLPASEQVSKFNQLFDSSRFNAIFRFYSAITKLQTPGINTVVINIVNKYSRSKGYCIPNKDKVLMISLLHCLYEAQDPSLCESVAQQLQHELDLKDTTLTPSDCLCIAYFLAHICKMVAGEFKVNLDGCSICDQGCKYLVSGLHRCLSTHSKVTTVLNLDVGRNNISHHGLHHLSTLLKIGCVNDLRLNGNNLLPEQDTTHVHFDTFAEQLKSNTTLKILWLQWCGLNPLSTKSLAEALTSNKYLEKLHISDNALCDDGIKHLAHALRVNQGLKYLLLVSCGMTDVGLECLAKSLQHNHNLSELHIWNLGSNQNKITEKIVPVLTECLQNNPTLTNVVLPENLCSSTTSIEEAVNDVRKRSGLPLIKVSVLSD